MGRVEGGVFWLKGVVSVACCQVQVWLCRGVSNWCCITRLVVARGCQICLWAYTGCLLWHFLYVVHVVSW